ncbi:geranylgeranylglyceryl/heptaprenylglyceryl phosphate synthase [Nonlabens xiamenensis]|uniref:geranylgeranylglyceryl/heptaprenylglyceryl phosphate synthase n=1 Tax=Nonlabens xiamenensis TaxID=2341043 RepID=UPI000F6134EF|nr:geranylgeranylglyceryl/heptaprenylglyceryl phosphate synthase [Nonlabens xiamenensis]
MSEILQNINASQRSLGILLDPEKLELNDLPAFAKAILPNIKNIQSQLQIDQLIFLVGGSTLPEMNLGAWVSELKNQVHLPILLFPGHHHQITEAADGLMFLQLISGRNPEYLIAQQIEAAKKLYNSSLEIIPTAYLLVDGGKETAVERVSKTKPMAQTAIESICDTAFAGQLMGNRLVYLEAGSGAIQAVSTEIIRKVSASLRVPLIVGGGLRKLDQMEKAYQAGASMLVVGTAIEQNVHWKG